MKKLLILSILLPCLVMFADDDDKSMIFWHNSGQVRAVHIGDIDSITAVSSSLVDDSSYLFYHDTLYVDVHDTTFIDVHDTTIVRETVYEEIHDTVIIPTFEQRPFNTASRWFVPIENPQVADYLYDFKYPDDDYSFTLIDDYLVETDYRKDIPLGVRLNWDCDASELIIEGVDDELNWNFHLTGNNHEFIVYNLIPGHRYKWRLINGAETVKESHFQTLGTVRMINTSSVYNVRDIGGKPTKDGRRTAFGKIYRGASLNFLNDDDRNIFLDSLCIDVELDVGLGTNETEWSGTSPKLGESVEYYGYIGKWINCIPMSSPQFTSYFKNVVYKVHELLKDHKTVYLHCGGGADRTGALAFLLETLAGCSENDIAKDYELTSFSQFGRRIRTNGNKIDTMTYEYASSVERLKNFGNGDMQAGMVYYLRYILHIDENTIVELQELLKE